MQLWTNWGFRKFVKLEVLGQALGCGCKAGHGNSVAQLWAARDLASIAAYCMAHVPGLLSLDVPKASYGETAGRR